MFFILNTLFIFLSDVWLLLYRSSGTFCNLAPDPTGDKVSQKKPSSVFFFQVSSDPVK